MSRSAGVGAAVAALVAALLSGCGPDDRADPWAGIAGAASADSSAPEQLGWVWEQLSALKHPPDCDALLEELKLKALADAEALLESHLEMVVETLEWGGPCEVYYWGEPNLSIEGGGASPTPVATPSSDSAQTYSTTNVQVVGVDEADFIKNDGSYLYVVADGRLLIIDAWPPEEAKISTAVELQGEPKKLYVHSDRALVYSSLEPLSGGYEDPVAGYYDPYLYDGSPEQECTYGYNCEFSGDGRRLEITLFDISDRTAPTLLREIEINGSYLNSRRLDDIVHTVITAPEVTVPGVQVWPDAVADYLEQCFEGTAAEFDYSELEVRRMFAELELDNMLAIDSATLADFLPSVRDTRYVGGEPMVTEGLLEQCEGFYLSKADDGNMRVGLLSLDITDLADLSTTTIVGKPGAVYASAEALYVATRHYRSQVEDWYFSGSEIDEATTIHKFALEPDSVFTRYAGSGVTKGRVLNQFSMDEYQGDLRIATTLGRVPDPDVHSTVTVLAEQEGRLQRVGIVDGIAPTEDIRSVRYAGDVGYVVTFKKTDPLFVIDLSDPRQPTLRGELHIPGYSTYLHPMDEAHLLTMGYDADEQGSFAWFSGLQLQVIDVAMLDAPTLLHCEIIGTRGSTSDAATNHLAFNYFPELELLAIPMTICEGGAEGSYGTELTFSGLLVYRVTVDGGFVLLGGIPHPIDTESGSSTLSCTNWWTDSDSKVKRSIFMESYVYSVALDQIRVSHLDQLDSPVASIALAAEP